MPNGRPGFLRGLAGRIGDKLVWGDNYNRQTGQWHSTPGQVLGGIGSRALNMFVPGAGTLVNAVGNGYYGQGPAARFFNNGPGEIQREQFGYDTSLNVPNIGMNAGIGMGAPQIGQPPQMPPVQVAGNGPIGGFQGGVFNGGAGNFGPGMRPGLHYGNGPGAGTGYGVSNYANDAWGQTALGFGIGSSAGGSGGSIALSDAQKAAGINRV